MCVCVYMCVYIYISTPRPASRARRTCPPQIRRWGSPLGKLGGQVDGGGGGPPCSMCRARYREAGHQVGCRRAIAGRLYSSRARWPTGLATRGLLQTFAARWLLIRALA